MCCRKVFFICTFHFTFLVTIFLLLLVTFVVIANDVYGAEDLLIVIYFITYT